MVEEEKQVAQAPSTFRFIIPGLSLFISVAFLYIGLTKYGFWDHTSHSPTPGFLPVIVSVGLIFCCLWMFIAEGRSGKKDSANFSKDELWVILGGFGVFVLTFLIGLIPTLLAYLIYWLKGFEKCSWKSTLKVSLIVMTIVIGVFYLWLEVPFPEGLILETLME